MQHGLIRSILRFHLAAEARVVEAWDPGDELPVRVDHVLAGGRSGLLALRAALRLAKGPPRVELALASGDRGAGPASFETPEEMQALHAAARRADVLFSKPGHGRGDIVHHEGFAVPGRLLLTSGRRRPATGALGMLAIVADPLEAAAALYGNPLYVEWPGVRYVDVSGALPVATSGTDAWLALATETRRRGWPEAFVEFSGAGIETLPMCDRLAIAGAGHALGARAVLFPSDEVTRAHMRALGREHEWKPLAGVVPDETDAVTTLDLSALVPRVADLDTPWLSRAVAETSDVSITVVEIGADASYPDLERLANMLEGRRIAAGVEVVVVPGSRLIMETAREEGVLDRLVGAGARVLEPGTRGSRSSAAATTGAGLCCGVRPEDRPDARADWWVGGIETCVAAALAGALRDPRTLEGSLGVSSEPERYVSTETWIVRPGSGADDAVDDQEPVFPLGAPIDASLRGSVLLVLGDRVSAEGVLPWGARIRPLAGDMQRLSQYVFSGIDGDFAARARRHGGGWIVAGAQFGSGVAREPAALALLALGVRGVLAVSFGADHRRHLVHAGILPLRFVVPEDHDEIGAGDELEVPGLPEVLVEGIPVVVRNLTRGTRFTARHELNSRQLATVIAGGLLRRAAAMVEV